ncbi:MAG: ASKHA domain-containing protein [Dehalococcoidales bacterium]|nr:ASKHA domain-containing protein [Dehalococcoidales bacterium]
MKDNTRKFKVTFSPDKKEIVVPEGTTLLEASEKAGVYVNSLCGGEGLCGECRLQVLHGKAQADKYAIGFFSAEEIKKGYVLACRTKVEDDLEVVVPSRSRIEKEKIITEGIPAYSEPAEESLPSGKHEPAFLFEPLVSKIYLELPPPTIADNVANIDRITRELRKNCTHFAYEVSLSCLQDLADKLRENDWKVTATIARHDGNGRILQIEGGNTTDRNYGLAVDVGTTTVVVQLVNLKTGKVIGVEGNHNQQAHYGEDVISRMVFACGRGSPEILQSAIVTNINALTLALAKGAGIDTKKINCLVASGNTTMSHFLYGLTPCSLRLEPYVPTATIYPQILAKEIGLNINPEGVVEMLPSVASYIGGDTVAGVLACGMANRSEVRCLIDCGTNAEIALGNNEWLVTCAASAGPAFEGGGTTWGMRATLGAIEKVEINKGRVSYQTISNGKPRGICGSGLIDCIYELARNKIIGRDGKFDLSLKDPRITIENDIPQYILAPAEETESGKAITISETDIGNLIKSKGAVFAALKSLVDYVGMTFPQIDTIYLAGGFGSSLDISKAVAIGLLPDIDARRIRYIGNSSVTGARMVLLSNRAFEAARIIAKRMTNIELSNYVPFMNEFIAALFLPHTDDKLFPSVKY